MKNLGLVLLELISLLGFLFDFCFKNLDLSTIQLAHLDFSLKTLFVIITFFEPIFSTKQYFFDNIL